ncbi:MAG: hypothetical protein GYB35_02910 [Algicola sp.]|nr:hypothetical protein [Algicola sp.]
MKTLKKMTLVVILLITTLSYAEKKEKNKANTYSKSIMVEFVNARKGQKLFVKDEFGIILHSETVKSSGDLSKSFDLKQLKDGKYTVELEKEYEIIIKPFEIKNDVLTFIQDKETKIFKPLVRHKKDRLLVSQLTFASEPVKVEIFYEGELIYSETIEDEKTVHRIYKLQKENFGNYYAIIKADDRSYIEYFKL